MAKTLKSIMAELPPARRAKIEARTAELIQEIESLAALRRIAGKAQTEIAAALDIKQPSVSKIERQTDIYLSTLTSYVEALGGELELIVRLPKHRTVRLRDLGAAMPPAKARTAA